jgi:hypothetical protein
VADLGQRCTHPWLRVTCGVCGEAIDALGEAPADPTSTSGAPSGPGDPSAARATFIVARGHPELIAQLRALMGHVSGVRIIEDRRQRPRHELSADEARELRKRLREEGQA